MILKSFKKIATKQNGWQNLMLFFCLAVFLSLSGCKPAVEKCFPYKCVKPDSFTNYPTDCQDFKVSDWRFSTEYLDANGVKQPSKEFGFISYLILKFQFTLSEGTKPIFEKFFKNSSFQDIYWLLVFFAIFGYGGFTLLQMKQQNPGEIAILAMKVGFITYLISDWNNFQNTIFSFFLNLQAGLISVFASASSGITDGALVANQENALLAIDNLFGQILLNGALWKIVASLFYPITNILLGLVMIFILWSLIMNLVSFVKAYLTALFGMFILAAIAPVFFALLLNDNTKAATDAWLDAMLSYVFQVPVLLLLMVITMNLVMTMITGCMITDLDKKLCNKQVLLFLILPVHWWVDETQGVGIASWFHTNPHINQICMIAMMIVLWVMNFVQTAMLETVKRITGALVNLGSPMPNGVGSLVAKAAPATAGFVGRRARAGWEEGANNFRSQTASRSNPAVGATLGAVSSVGGFVWGAIGRPVWGATGRPIVGLVKRAFGK
jgi:type IV secretory pathway VirB6-like protein